MDQFRAPFATHWEHSRGRLHPEAPSRTRTPFQRDRDRIIHSTAFRRLQHKTQVFISPEADHVRTRLTHSIEVSQIARSLCRVLRGDEDLTEALALAHDLGHTPFGHTGEDALDDLMQPFGGFDHNDQALRILVKLEHRYPDFDGLNLTWETLEGVVKHNGPVLKDGMTADGLPATLKSFNKMFDLELSGYAGLEAQIAAIADDIAYNHHDMDDGLRAGLFTVQAVSDAVPHVGAVFADVRKAYPDCEDSILISETVRRLIGDMVGDVLRESHARLRDLRPVDAGDIRGADRAVVGFSEEMAANERALKRFLFTNMYRAASVNEDRERSFRIVGDLFRHYMRQPQELPGEWRPSRGEALGGTVAGDFDAATARIVADYIAGMTDRFAKRLHRKLKL